ncbi:MAG: hypothetical protein ABJC26_03330 [Gemmatimonadaceae bacterium]
MRFSFRFVFPALLLFSGCRREVVDPTPRELSTAHFVLHYYGMDTAATNGLMRHLESNRARVMKDLSVDSMPIVQIFVMDDSAFQKRWGATIGGSGIKFQVKALANGVDEIYVYGPLAIKNATDTPMNVLHEFAHAVTLQLALSKGDSSHWPGRGDSTTAKVADRWLAEAIAVYEAGQSTDVNWIGAIRRGDYPTIAELNDPSNGLIYGVGYRIIEYVRKQWGGDAVVKLVLAHGNVRVLHVTSEEFEDGWYDWLAKRYLIINPKRFGDSRYSRRMKAAKH